MTPLSRLADLGTSVWLDGLVAPDERRRLVAEDAVTGLTSNPTIFRAADVLRPVFASTDGRDGFVSLEVAPELAHDVAGTVGAARHLWTMVGGGRFAVRAGAARLTPTSFTPKEES